MDIRIHDEAEALECFRRLGGELRTTAAWLLGRIDAAEPGDTDTNSCITAAVEALGLLGRVNHGTLMQFVARAQQRRALPGGAPAFLAATEGVSPGRARTFVEDAQRITVEPEISEWLSEGRLSPEGTRVIARTLKAVAGLEVPTQRQAVIDAMTTIEAEGLTEAVRQIPRWEEKDEPGTLEDIAARQRRRSFARVTALAHGACRFDILLDAERALLMRAGLDAFTSCARLRRAMGLAIVPDDVRTAEQIAAEAFTRFVEVFLNASTEKREVGFRIPTLLYGNLGASKPVAETVYGDRLPGSILPRPDDPAAEVVLFDKGGRLLLMNGELIDRRGFWERVAPRLQKKFTFRTRMAGH